VTIVRFRRRTTEKGKNNHLNAEKKRLGNRQGRDGGVRGNPGNRGSNNEKQCSEHRGGLLASRKKDPLTKSCGTKKRKAVEKEVPRVKPQGLSDAPSSKKAKKLKKKDATCNCKWERGKGKRGTKHNLWGNL